MSGAHLLMASFWTQQLVGHC